MSEPKDLDELEQELENRWVSIQVSHENMGEKVIQRIQWRSRLRWGLSCAAALVCALGLFWVLELKPNHVLDSRLEASLKWLKREQLDSGAWDAVKWGGKERFTVGVSALALMSIMQLGGDVEAESTQKAIDFLVSQQQDHGLIGPEFLGDLYNHSLATLALKRAKSVGLEVSDKCIEKAESFLLKFRTDQQYWAYREGMEAERNLTEWATLAIKGWHDYELNWKPDRPSESQTYALNRSDARSMDSMDVFFQQMTGPHNPNVRDSLLNQQEQNGHLLGSWPIEGKWSHVGGRVFTTGMAVLCLKPLTI